MFVVTLIEYADTAFGPQTYEYRGEIDMKCLDIHLTFPMPNGEPDLNLGIRRGYAFTCRRHSPRNIDEDGIRYFSIPQSWSGCTITFMRWTNALILACQREPSSPDELVEDYQFNKLQLAEYITVLPREGALPPSTTLH